MKEYCPKCKKEVEMYERLEDLDEDTGVFVKAFVCKKCGESLTEASEYMRAQKEVMAKNILKIPREIIKIGNSFGIRLPKEAAEAAQLHEKEKVNIYVDSKRRIIVEPA